MSNLIILFVSENYFVASLFLIDNMTAEISLIFFADASKIIKKTSMGVIKVFLDAVKMQQKHLESDGWQNFC